MRSRCVCVSLSRATNFRGLLQGLQEQQVVIQEQDGKRVSLPLEQIEQARLCRISNASERGDG